MPNNIFANFSSSYLCQKQFAVQSKGLQFSMGVSHLLDLCLPPLLICWGSMNALLIITLTHSTI